MYPLEERGWKKIVLNELIGDIQCHKFGEVYNNIKDAGQILVWKLDHMKLISLLLSLT